MVTAPMAVMSPLKVMVPFSYTLLAPILTALRVFRLPVYNTLAPS
jgi:hypothetical protein